MGVFFRTPPQTQINKRLRFPFWSPEKAETPKKREKGTTPSLLKRKRLIFEAAARGHRWSPKSERHWDLSHAG